MNAPAVTSTDIQAAYAAFRAESRQSLLKYLDHVVIDATPPVRWAEVIAPFQLDMVRQSAGAIESAEGFRDDYAGKRRFWWTLPRGHDKTGFIGRLVTHGICFAKRKIKAVAAAGDKDQAKLLTESMEREAGLNPWIPITVKKYDADGPTGTLEILSSDAPTASGIIADIIVVDEVTYWKNRKLWDMIVAGASKRPHAVVIVITNAGIRDTWQWEVREAARVDPLWSFLEAPTRTCLAHWINPAQRESDRQFLTAAHASRVYDNVWTRASDIALLDAVDIEACRDNAGGNVERFPKGVLWKSESEAGRIDAGATRYVGVDIGRKRHLTVITTVERDAEADVAMREMIVLDRVPFADQVTAIERAARRRGVRALRIDMGGIGMQLAEHFETSMPAIAKGVACGDSWQGQAALKVARRFRSQSIVIPDDPTLAADLQQVDEVGNSAGGVPILRTKQTDIGHADRFWSLALAVDAMPADSERIGRGPRPVGTSAGRPSRTLDRRSSGAVRSGAIRRP